MTENKSEQQDELNIDREPQDDKTEVSKEKNNALQSEGKETQSEKQDEEDKVETVKCPRCGQETPKSVRLCMFCGYDLVEKPYVPMDKKKVRIIKWAIGIPLVIIFLIWFFILRS